ncbi:MAG: hypothetical protein LBK25_07575 [Treponema sp.]|nr:hypothetical protein [Treponema sp.]
MAYLFLYFIEYNKSRRKGEGGEAEVHVVPDTFDGVVLLDDFLMDCGGQTLRSLLIRI